jgi:hypothetical protein
VHLGERKEKKKGKLPCTPCVMKIPTVKKALQRKVLLYEFSSLKKEKGSYVSA